MTLVFISKTRSDLEQKYPEQMVILNPDYTERTGLNKLIRAVREN